MSMWTRIANVFRGEKLDRDIDEEIASHLADAIEDGRDPAEARRALGSPLKHRDEAHDARVFVWLDSLRADAVYGWRRLARSKVTTAAAILSLGLAIGACTAAFRLADALLWRPLPIVAPNELYEVETVGVGFDGKPETGNHWSYSQFVAMRDAVKGDAELIANTTVSSQDVQIPGTVETEKANVQYVTGSMFGSFGLRPAAGRLLNFADDATAGGQAYAALSDQYWKRRFSRDPHVVGGTFQFGGRVYDIIGVAAPPFTGTTPGKMADIFLPVTMSPYAKIPSVSILNAYARVPAGTPLEPLRDHLQSVAHALFAEQLERMPGLQEQMKDMFLNRNIALEAAPSGSSSLQNANRRPLGALFVISLLVLLIACANVANLVTAQTAARERELALRVSIGGGRRRLVQLVLAESVWIGIAAAALGAAFSSWAAPRVVAMINPPDDPARLALALDWRVLAFLGTATFAMTLLFGLAPALRASKVDPASALKGGNDPRASGRTMHGLIAVQVGVCVFVVFTAGLFVTTFERLTHKPTGFSSNGILTITTNSNQTQPWHVWTDAMQALAQQPGIASAALASWPLLDGTESVSVVGLPGGAASQVLAYQIQITPGWADTMGVRILEGRDLKWDDSFEKEALVNETFAKTYFGGAAPLGKTFTLPAQEGEQPIVTVVGLVADACYADLRQCAVPTMYFPFAAAGTNGKPSAGTKFATFIVRAESANPLAVAQSLRIALQRTAPELHVMRMRTQQEVNDAQTIHERLLSTLAAFFAAVAILLAGVGLFGVLNYSVLRRRREIGIRIAVGAQPASIARTVIATAFVMVIVGAAAGLAAGAFAVRPLESLFYEVKATDAAALALPALAILVAALVAAVPAVVRAVRIDPVILLRSE
jgi:predicted permease